MVGKISASRGVWVGGGGGSNLGPLEGELKPRTARSVGQA